jgi:UDP-2-acetamido-3-amino-2,3-dideoxy-glucuronate N-acetyltransferase
VFGATVIGPGCLVEAGAVLGKRPRLRPGSSAASAASAASATSDAGSAGSAGSTGELIVGEGVTICAGAVVYAGAQLGARVIVGDQAQVRERVRLGERTVVGRGSTIQTLVYLTARGLVEDDVFIGPGVTTTNDDTMGRHPRGEPLRGPILRRACRLGGGCVLTPGVEIGEEAFVAAGAVVTRDVPARAVVMGVPARVVREVGDADLIQRWR